MIDIHTHSFLSDGVLVPSELVRRCQIQGCRALAITDHVGPANIEFVVESIAEFCEVIAGAYEEIDVLPGCELTHVPPVLIPKVIEQARELGAEIVLVHGETIVEPVAEGTNRAAIEGGCDVLAHPGLITPDEARLAAGSGVMLELSGRKGHSLTNGYLAALSRNCGAQNTFGSDGHVPGDYPTRDFAEQILRGAGLNDTEIATVFRNNASFFEAD
jgi:histidinol phosphatase-like PHP family hydrolase